VCESMKDSFPKPVEEYIYLYNDGVDKKSVDYGGPRVCSDESHKKSEAYQHHHVHILKGGVPLAL